MLFNPFVSPDWLWSQFHEANNNTVKIHIVRTIIRFVFMTFISLHFLYCSLFPPFLPQNCSIFSLSSVSSLSCLTHFCSPGFQNEGESSQWYVSDLHTKEPQRGHNARGHMITGQTHKKCIKHGGLSAVVI